MTLTFAELQHLALPRTRTCTLKSCISREHTNTWQVDEGLVCRSPLSAQAPTSQAGSDERWHPGAEIVRLQRRVADQTSKLEVGGRVALTALLRQQGMMIVLLQLVCTVSSLDASLSLTQRLPCGSSVL